MKEIKNISVLGAGAMGASYASIFFNTAGFSTSLVAQEPRSSRLRSEGLVVNNKKYFIPVISPEQSVPPADLIIVALKNHDLPGAIHDLKNLVGDKTIIISVMNGLDSEERLGSVYGKDKVLYAIAVGIDALRDGNSVTYTTSGKIVFGEADNTEISEKVRTVQTAFERAGLLYDTPPDMIRMLWWKFMINVGINQASAVMRAPYGVFQSSPEAQSLSDTLMREVIALAEPLGVNLSQLDINGWKDVLKGLSPKGKTSMLQDIEAGRKTEVEVFAGKVVELGEKLGVQTPVNQACLSIIRVLEQPKW